MNNFKFLKGSISAWKSILLCYTSVNNKKLYDVLRFVDNTESIDDDRILPFDEDKITFFVGTYLEFRAHIIRERRNAHFHSPIIHAIRIFNYFNYGRTYRTMRYQDFREDNYRFKKNQRMRFYYETF